MADTPDERPWTAEDEENALLEVSEDKRLMRLGIDPNGSELDIHLELLRRMRKIEESERLKSDK